MESDPVLLAQLLVSKTTHLIVLIHISEGRIHLELQTEGHLQLYLARKTLLLAESIRPLNILNGLCEAFLAFFFPVRADAVPPVPHKSVSVQGL